MSCRGEVKSFNAKAGWGFISYNGTDVFLHVKDCGPTFRPKQGAEVSFDTADNDKQPGQKVARNVRALSVGNCEGVVKSFVDKKGYGFIQHEDHDVFLHINDCVDGRPAPGDQVNFDVEESEKTPGQMIAKRVTGCSKMLDPDDGKGKGKGKDEVPHQGGKGDKGGKQAYGGGCKGGADYRPAPGWGGPPAPAAVPRFCEFTGRPLDVPRFCQYTGRPLYDSPPMDYGKGGYGAAPPMDYGYAKGGYGAPAPYGYDKGGYGKGAGKPGGMDKGFKGGKGKY